MRFSCFIGFLSAILCFCSTAGATLRVWTGNSTLNSDWNNAANWSVGVAPVAGDDLEFPSDALHPNCTDNYTNGTTFNSIIFTNGGGASPKLFNLMGNSIALNGGIRLLNAGSTLWPNTMNNALVLNSNQTFATGPFTSLSLDGAINLNGKELTFDTAAASPIDAHVVISGAGSLIKTNPGTLTLYSNNTYTGSTTVSGGMLALSGLGAIPNSTNIAVSGASAIFRPGNAFTLSSGQKLSGIGSVGGNVSVASGAILSPGNNGVGTLTVSNFLTLNATSSLIAVLNGTNSATSYGQVYAQSGVALFSPTLSLALGYTPAPGDSFMIITNGGAGAVNGTFNGLPEGTFFTNNGLGFRITYTGGDGNDVVLTRTNPPTPGPPIIVTTTADSGAGSLRAVLAAATNDNSIVFATNVTGAIKLTMGELLVNQSVSILGPGPAILAVDGNAASRVFHVTNGVNAFISGLTITNGAVLGGLVVTGGGGIWNDHSTLVLSNCVVIFNNSGNGPGGGINNDGGAGSANLSIIASTLSQNYTTSGNGGGIENYGVGGRADLSIIASVFDHNASQGTDIGGGIFNDGHSGSATVTVSNSTFFFNIASQNGGGIYNSGASGTGAVTVVASTFSGNSSGNNGGASFYNTGAGAKIEVAGTILNANQIQGNILNVGGVIVSDGYNLCSDAGGGFLTNSTDRVSTDPRLGSFANNGGPTKTLALLWGSPAVDKGKSFGLTTDQRGVSRTYDFGALTNATGGDGTDIGAFELIPSVQFTSIAALTNHSVLLQGLGLSNLTYTIQGTTNLNPIIAWTNLGTATASNTGAFSFTDTNAPSFPERFYRALLP